MQTNTPFTASQAIGCTATEKGYMFTESKVYHLKELIEFSSKYERKNINWKDYIPTIIQNVGAAFIGYAFFNAISLWIGLQNSSNILTSWLVIGLFLIFGILLLVIVFVTNNQKDKMYESFNEKALQLINKTLEMQNQQIDNQNSLLDETHSPN